MGGSAHWAGSAHWVRPPCLGRSPRLGGSPHWVRPAHWGGSAHWADRLAWVWIASLNPTPTRLVGSPRFDRLASTESLTWSIAFWQSVSSDPCRRTSRSDCPPPIAPSECACDGWPNRYAAAAPYCPKRSVLPIRSPQFDRPPDLAQSTGLSQQSRLAQLSDLIRPPHLVGSPHLDRLASTESLTWSMAFRQPV